MNRTAVGYFLLSLWVHCLGISIANCIPINARPKSIKEAPVLVHLVEEVPSPYVIDNPIGFDPSVPLGEKTQTTSQAKAVYHSTESSLNNQAYQNGQENTVTEGTSYDGKTLEEIFASLEEHLGNLEEHLGNLQKGLEEVAEDVGKVQKGLEEVAEDVGKVQTTVGVASVVFGHSSLDEHFKHTYKEGDRTEQTYYDFFRALGCAYYSFFDNHSSIDSILLSNAHVEGILSLEFTFYEDGKFELSNIRPKPEFKDQDGRVLEHYRKFFTTMHDGKFIPPSLCGLETPYVAKYRLVNPVHSENVLLQNN